MSRRGLTETCLHMLQRRSNFIAAQHSHVIGPICMSMSSACTSWCLFAHSILLAKSPAVLQTQAMRQLQTACCGPCLMIRVLGFRAPNP